MRYMRFHPTPRLAKEIKDNDLDKRKNDGVVYKSYMSHRFSF